MAFAILQVKFADGETIRENLRESHKGAIIMELKIVDLLIPEGANLILGHAHFIKTVEDLYEILITSGLGVEFGLAFSEASGECLIRVEGNDKELMAAAIENATRIWLPATLLIFCCAKPFPLICSTP